jgi:hypothetical protein
MTAWAHVCRAPRVQPDRDWLLHVYRSKSVSELTALRGVLETARATATDRDTIAFCDWRLPLIAQVLGERKEVTPDDGDPPI